MSVSDDVANRRRRDPAGEPGVIGLATDALKDFANLLQTELELLRAEISEKLTFIALSMALIGAGALLLAATIVLVLQAAIAGLVAYGFSWPVAILVVAAISLLAGGGLVWVGIHNLSFGRLVPTKTVTQVQKDTTIANLR
jgi:uncharacterized membrane protein YqjE